MGLLDGVTDDRPLSGDLHDRWELPEQDFDPPFTTDAPVKRDGNLR